MVGVDVVVETVGVGDEVLVAGGGASVLVKAFVEV